MQESLLSVITMEDSKVIQYAIWGVLPEDYEEDWKEFQNQWNTLNISVDRLLSDVWYARSMMHRRCLIIATGFFTFSIREGEAHPYLVHLPKKKHFCLAGLYTVTNDGFITCSPITVPSDSFITNIQNLGNEIPVVLSKHQQIEWLDSKTKMHELSRIMNNPTHQLFRANPMGKDFFGDY